jgi:EAL domain-containing protein (putative c-di-GMP-specific phosphodiesterase class I)
LAKRHLEMDVAYVSHLYGGRENFEAVAGRTGGFGVTVGESVPWGATYCSEMVKGIIPPVIPDARADPRVRDLPMTNTANIGAYIGVPLRLSDGTLYGSLCCASHHAEPELSSRDLRFLRMLADFLVDELDRENDRLATRESIASVLAGRHLDIALQPIVRLSDGRRIGVEALSRFPFGGRPDEMFRAAHSVGLGADLERLAVERALEVMTRLDENCSRNSEAADGYDSTHLSEFMAINLSPTSFTETMSVAERFPRAPLQRLVFEITEHQAVDQYGDLLSELRELRRNGLRVAIDDAGAGYASLYHIVQVHPDIIKIDRRLVDGCSEDQSRRSVIKGFVGLAHDIGAMVVGEGVETSADLAVLRGLGVDAAQGYLLGRPTLAYETLNGSAKTTQLIRDLPVPRAGET